MNTVGERILEIKNRFFGGGYGSNVKFAKAINVEPNVVSNWFLRGDGIGVAVMQQVLAFDKSIDANWLITGEGQMLKQESCSPLADNASNVYKDLFEKRDAEVGELREDIGKLKAEKSLLEDKYMKLAEDFENLKAKITLKNNLSHGLPIVESVKSAHVLENETATL